MPRVMFIRKLISPNPDPIDHKVFIDQNRAGSLYHVALELAKERNAKLKLLKDAILKGDTDTVYRIAADVCGIGEFYESYEARYRAS